MQILDEKKDGSDLRDFLQQLRWRMLKDQMDRCFQDSSLGPKTINCQAIRDLAGVVVGASMADDTESADQAVAVMRFLEGVVVLAEQYLGDTPAPHWSSFLNKKQPEINQNPQSAQLEKPSEEGQG